MSTNLIGQTIRGRYHIIKQLGRGGVGITFLAQDRQCFDSHCVVKQLKPQSEDPKTLEVTRRLFNKEADILNTLGHSDHIPRLLAYFEHNQDFFLVQELIEGEDLSTEIIAGCCLKTQEAIKLITDILEILVEVQQYNVIHRDLKPSNLMRRSKDRTLMMIDFGSVKQVSTQIVDSKGRVKPTVVVGTESYMPMEQMMGHPGLHSDIYAVGVIAIQALTGAIPRNLPIDNDGELIWHDQLPSDANCPTQLLDIIDKMVRYRFQERYASATHVLQDLQKLKISSNRGFALQFKPQIAANTTNNQSPLLGAINKQLLALLIAIPLSLVAIFGLITSRKTPSWSGNNIAELAVYENPDYGFKIKRPEDWSQRNRDDFVTSEVVFTSALENETDNFQESVSIAIENLGSEMSLDEYTQDSIEQIKQLSDPGVENPQNTILSDTAAQTVTYHGEKNGYLVRRMQTWTVIDQRAYVITYTADPQAYQDYLPTIEKMMRSFEIIPQ